MVYGIPSHPINLLVTEIIYVNYINKRFCGMLDVWLANLIILLFLC